MKNVFIVLFIIFCTACAATTSSNISNTSNKIQKITIVVEGLEQEYTQEIINSIKQISGYVKYTAPVNKDGMLEIICRFNDSPNLQKDIYDELNTVFMTLSKTVSISTAHNYFRAVVTTY